MGSAEKLKFARGYASRKIWVDKSSTTEYNLVVDDDLFVIRVREDRCEHAI